MLVIEYNKMVVGQVLICLYWSEAWAPSINLPSDRTTDISPVELAMEYEDVLLNQPVVFDNVSFFLEIKLFVNVNC